MPRKVAAILALVFLCASLLPVPADAGNTDIVITEIGAYEPSDHEWIEIYNKGTTSVDLTGWKFFEDGTNHGLAAFRGGMSIGAGEYAVIADVAASTATDYPGFTGILIDSSWTTLTETGEALALKDAGGVIVESFAYIAAPTHSLERADATKNDYTNTNWKEHASGNTIGAKNSNAVSATPPPPAPTPSPVSPAPSPAPQPTPTPSPTPQATPTGANATPLWTPSRGDVLISEFVADPVDDEKEWVELYNTSGQNIPLTGWTLEDGSGAQTSLFGTLGNSGVSRFVVFESPKGGLNNAGDRILLRDPSRNQIDDISYGNWDDGNVTNNAPTAHDPFSIARKGDGVNSFNNKTDFAITKTPTRGTSNIITDDSVTTPGDVGAAQPLVKNLFISELLPNPAGADTKDEFIEIYNTGTDSIDLSSWELVSGQGKKYIIDKKDLPSTIIPPKTFLALFRPVTKLALKNSGGDSIALYQPGQEKPTARAFYTDSAPQGSTWVRRDDGTSTWSATPTPGSVNTITIANRPPAAVLYAPKTAMVGEELSFDGSDSSDADGDALTMKWSFGDESESNLAVVSHRYIRADTYTVSLVVGDGKHTATETMKIKIVPATGDTAASSTDISETTSPTDTPADETATPSIVINEIFPRPESGTEEFIELVNLSTDSRSLAGWSLHTETSQRSYTFPEGTTLDSKGLLAIPRSVSKLALKNAAEVVALYDDTGTLVDMLEYEDAPLHASLSRDGDGNVQWTNRPTQEEDNVIQPYSDAGSAGDADSDTNDGEPVKKDTLFSTDTPSSKKSSKSSKKVKSPVAIIETTLAALRSLGSGTKVRVQGVVSVHPGILGKTVMYIAGSGVQIYSQSKSFPALTEGDMVRVEGKISQSAGETRITIPDAGALQKIGSGTPPQPHAAETGDINESLEGNLVSIAGDVMEVKWPNIFIDDGTEEARVYVKKTTGIANMKLKVGEHLAVTGVVSQTQAGYRVLPRFATDVVRSAASKDAAMDMSDPAKETTKIGARNPFGDALKYIIATAVGGVVLVLGLGLQYVLKKKP